eukprot:gene7008-10811_t
MKAFSPMKERGVFSGTPSTHLIAVMDKFYACCQALNESDKLELKQTVEISNWLYETSKQLVRLAERQLVAAKRAEEVPACCYKLASSILRHELDGQLPTYGTKHRIRLGAKTLLEVLPASWEQDKRGFDSRVFAVVNTAHELPDGLFEAEKKLVIGCIQSSASSDRRAFRQSDTLLRCCAEGNAFAAELFYAAWQVDFRTSTAAVQRTAQGIVATLRLNFPVTPSIPNALSAAAVLLDENACSLFRELGEGLRQCAPEGGAAPAKSIAMLRTLHRGCTDCFDELFERIKSHGISYRQLECMKAHGVVAGITRLTADCNGAAFQAEKYQRELETIHERYFHEVHRKKQFLEQMARDPTHGARARHFLGVLGKEEDDARDQPLSQLDDYLQSSFLPVADALELPVELERLERMLRSDVFRGIVGGVLEATGNLNTVPPADYSTCSVDDCIEAWRTSVSKLYLPHYAELWKRVKTGVATHSDVFDHLLPQAFTESLRQFRSSLVADPPSTLTKTKKDTLDTQKKMLAVVADFVTREVKTANAVLPDDPVPSSVVADVRDFIAACLLRRDALSFSGCCKQLCGECPSLVDNFNDAVAHLSAAEFTLGHPYQDATAAASLDQKVCAEPIKAYRCLMAQLTDFNDIGLGYIYHLDGLLREGLCPLLSNMVPPEDIECGALRSIDVFIEQKSPEVDKEDVDLLMCFQNIAKKFLGCPADLSELRRNRMRDPVSFLSFLSSTCGCLQAAAQLGGQLFQVTHLRSATDSDVAIVCARRIIAHGRFTISVSVDTNAVKLSACDTCEGSGKVGRTFAAEELADIPPNILLTSQHKTSRKAPLGTEDMAEDEDDLEEDLDEDPDQTLAIKSIGDLQTPAARKALANRFVSVYTELKELVTVIEELRECGHPDFNCLPMDIGGRADQITLQTMVTDFCASIAEWNRFTDQATAQLPALSLVPRRQIPSAIALVELCTDPDEAARQPALEKLAAVVSAVCSSASTPKDIAASVNGCDDEIALIAGKMPRSTYARHAGVFGLLVQKFMRKELLDPEFPAISKQANGLRNRLLRERQSTHSTASIWRLEDANDDAQLLSACCSIYVLLMRRMPQYFENLVVSEHSRPSETELRDFLQKCSRWEDARRLFNAPPLFCIVGAHLLPRHMQEVILAHCNAATTAQSPAADFLFIEFPALDRFQAADLDVPTLSGLSYADPAAQFCLSTYDFRFPAASRASTPAANTIIFNVEKEVNETVEFGVKCLAAFDTARQQATNSMPCGAATEQTAVPGSAAVLEILQRLVPADPTTRDHRRSSQLRFLRMAAFQLAYAFTTDSIYYADMSAVPEIHLGTCMMSFHVAELIVQCCVNLACDAVPQKAHAGETEAKRMERMKGFGTWSKQPFAVFNRGGDFKLFSLQEGARVLKQMTDHNPNRHFKQFIAENGQLDQMDRTDLQTHATNASASVNAHSVDVVLGIISTRPNLGQVRQLRNRLITDESLSEVDTLEEVVRMEHAQEVDRIRTTRQGEEDAATTSQVEDFLRWFAPLLVPANPVWATDPLSKSVETLVMGIDEWYRNIFGTFDDPQAPTVITADLLVRLAAMKIRLVSHIPVVWIGDQGCGKTHACQAFARGSGYEWALVNCNGAVTAQVLLQKMLPLIDRALRHPDRIYLLQLDEFNTLHDVWNAHQIMCDRMILGRRIPDNIPVIAIMNPTKERTEEQKEAFKAVDMLGGFDYTQYEQIDRNAAAGPPGTAAGAAKIYDVEESPEALISLAFDFGSAALTLTPVDSYMATSTALRTCFVSIPRLPHDGVSDEIRFAESSVHWMVFRNLRAFKEREICGKKFGLTHEFNRAGDGNGDGLHWKAFRTVVVTMMRASQEFLRREFAQETSVVSLRDMNKVVRIIPFIMECFVARQEFLQETLNRVEFPFFQYLSESVQCGFVLTYHLRLDPAKRTAYLDTLLLAWKAARAEFGETLHAQFMKLPADGELIYTEAFDRMGQFVVSCLTQEGRLAHQSLAPNQALKENTFAALVSIMLTMTLFIVGRAGSSKTRALQSLIAASERACADRKVSFFSLIRFQIRTHILQCSRHTKAADVSRVVVNAAAVQRGSTDIRSVVVLEEAGATSGSVHNPFMTLHGIIDYGVSLGPNDWERVSIIGISNWQLGQAKMGRGNIVHRGNPPVDDLVETGKFFLNAPADGWLRRFCSQFHALVLRGNGCCTRFFGMRDAYTFFTTLVSLAKLDLRDEVGVERTSYVRQQRDACGDVLRSPHLVRWALVLAFGGMPAHQAELEGKLLDSLLGSFTPFERGQDAKWRWREGDVERKLCDHCAYMAFLKLWIATGRGRTADDDAAERELTVAEQQRRKAGVFQQHAVPLHQKHPCDNFPQEDTLPTHAVARQSTAILAYGLTHYDTRHSLIFTRSANAIRLLSKLGLVLPTDTVIAGTPRFQTDLAEQLRRIKDCMARGGHLVVVGLHLTEVLLEPLNMNYVASGSGDYVVYKTRLPLADGHSKLVRVNPTFRCTVVCEEAQAEMLLPPFIQRFTKTNLSFQGSLSFEQQQVIAKVTHAAQILSTAASPGGAGLAAGEPAPAAGGSIFELCVPGVSSETVPSLVFLPSTDPHNSTWKRISLCFMPKVLLRLELGLFQDITDPASIETIKLWSARCRATGIAATLWPNRNGQLKLDLLDAWNSDVTGSDTVKHFFIMTEQTDVLTSNLVLDCEGVIVEGYRDEDEPVTRVHVVSAHQSSPVVDVYQDGDHSLHLALKRAAKLDLAQDEAAILVVLLDCSTPNSSVAAATANLYHTVDTAGLGPRTHVFVVATVPDLLAVPAAGAACPFSLIFDPDWVHVAVDTVTPPELPIGWPLADVLAADPRVLLAEVARHILEGDGAVEIAQQLHRCMAAHPSVFPACGIAEVRVLLHRFQSCRVGKTVLDGLAGGLAEQVPAFDGSAPDEWKRAALTRSFRSCATLRGVLVSFLTAVCERAALPVLIGYFAYGTVRCIVDDVNGAAELVHSALASSRSTEQPNAFLPEGTPEASDACLLVHLPVPPLSFSPGSGAGAAEGDAPAARLLEVVAGYAQRFPLSHRVFAFVAQLPHGDPQAAVAAMRRDLPEVMAAAEALQADLVADFAVMRFQASPACLDAVEAVLRSLAATAFGEHHLPQTPVVAYGLLANRDAKLVAAAARLASEGKVAAAVRKWVTTAEERFLSGSKLLELVQDGVGGVIDGGLLHTVETVCCGLGEHPAADARAHSPHIRNLRPTTWHWLRMVNTAARSLDAEGKEELEKLGQCLVDKGPADALAYCLSAEALRRVLRGLVPTLLDMIPDEAADSLRDAVHFCLDTPVLTEHDHLATTFAIIQRVFQQWASRGFASPCPLGHRPCYAEEPQLPVVVSAVFRHLTKPENFFELQRLLQLFDAVAGERDPSLLHVASRRAIVMAALDVVAQSALAATTAAADGENGPDQTATDGWMTQTMVLSIAEQGGALGELRDAVDAAIAGWSDGECDMLRLFFFRQITGSGLDTQSARTALITPGIASFVPSCIKQGVIAEHLRQSDGNVAGLVKQMQGFEEAQILLRSAVADMQKAPQFVNYGGMAARIAALMEYLLGLQDGEPRPTPQDIVFLCTSFSRAASTLIVALARLSQPLDFPPSALEVWIHSVAAMLGAASCRQKQKNQPPASLLSAVASIAAAGASAAASQPLPTVATSVEYDRIVGDATVTYIYQCPNGHKYGTNNCEHINSQGTCPQCGALIGGAAYGQLHQGNTRLGPQAAFVGRRDLFARTTGWDPLYRGATVREMPAAAFHGLRILVVSAVLAANVGAPAAAGRDAVTLASARQDFLEVLRTASEGVFNNNKTTQPVADWMHALLHKLDARDPALVGDVAEEGYQASVEAFAVKTITENPVDLIAAHTEEGPMGILDALQSSKRYQKQLASGKLASLPLTEQQLGQTFPHLYNYRAPLVLRWFSKALQAEPHRPLAILEKHAKSLTNASPVRLITFLRYIEQLQRAVRRQRFTSASAARATLQTVIRHSDADEEQLGGPKFDEFAAAVGFMSMRVDSWNCFKSFRTTFAAVLSAFRKRSPGDIPLSVLLPTEKDEGKFVQTLYGGSCDNPPHLAAHVTAQIAVVKSIESGRLHQGIGETRNMSCLPFALVRDDLIAGDFKAEISRLLFTAHITPADVPPPLLDSAVDDVEAHLIAKLDLIRYPRLRESLPTFRFSDMAVESFFSRFGEEPFEVPAAAPYNLFLGLSSAPRLAQCVFAFLTHAIGKLSVAADFSLDTPLGSLHAGDEELTHDQRQGRRFIAESAATLGGCTIRHLPALYGCIWDGAVVPAASVDPDTDTNGRIEQGVAALAADAAAPVGTVMVAFRLLGISHMTDQDKAATFWDDAMVYMLPSFSTVFDENASVVGNPIVDLPAKHYAAVLSALEHRFKHLVVPQPPEGDGGADTVASVAAVFKATRRQGHASGSPSEAPPAQADTEPIPPSNRRPPHRRARQPEATSSAPADL